MKSDTNKTLGKFALEPSTSRGEWLTSWAASHRLILANTYFDKPPSDICTYHSPSQQPRQLDYILVGKAMWKRTRDAHSSNCPDLGSDHRAVRIRLDLSTTHVRTPRRQQHTNKQQPTRWPPDDYIHYRHCIDRALDNSSTTTTDLDSRCEHINSSIVRATQQSMRSPQNDKRTPAAASILQRMT